MIFQRIRQPAKLIPLAFISFILLGTFLLMLPISTRQESASFLTALFTAVSATCVTGLAVTDTATYWTGFGQAVIFVLFQVGGFGVMSAAALVSLWIAKDSPSLSHQITLQTERNNPSFVDIKQVMKLALHITIVIELSIAVMVAARLALHYDEPLPKAIWNGLFHAVSSFNNAGFSTYSDNLMSFAHDPWILIALALAFMMGGLGFPIYHELKEYYFKPLSQKNIQRQSGMMRPCFDQPRTRLSLHTRFTLWGSFILLLVGTILLAAFEWHNPKTLGSMDVGSKILGAFFESASTRTAGFNALDIGGLTQASLNMHYVWMLIGGGSAGTAGGVKVTTIMILALVVWSEVRGHQHVECMGRHIPHHNQRQALSILTLALMVVMVGTQLLVLLTDLSFSVLLFEVISAFATVGLSTGITPQLPPSAQWVLIFLMFIGRIGAMTFLMSMIARRRVTHYQYPKESVIVG